MALPAGPRPEYSAETLWRVAVGSAELTITKCLPARPQQESSLLPFCNGSGAVVRNAASLSVDLLVPFARPSKFPKLLMQSSWGMPKHRGPRACDCKRNAKDM